jgi:hypothetical protein
MTIVFTQDEIKEIILDYAKEQYDVAINTIKINVSDSSIDSVIVWEEKVEKVEKGE